MNNADKQALQRDRVCSALWRHIDGIEATQRTIAKVYGDNLGVGMHDLNKAKDLIHDVIKRLP